jgi:hypothetical protein
MKGQPSHYELDRFAHRINLPLTNTARLCAGLPRMTRGLTRNAGV